MMPLRLSAAFAALLWALSPALVSAQYTSPSYQSNEVFFGIGGDLDSSSSSYQAQSGSGALGVGGPAKRYDFPLANPTLTGWTANDVNHVITLPAYSVGQYVYIVIWLSSNNLGVNTPSGWTRLTNLVNNVTLQSFTRKMQSGDGTTVTFTTNSNRQVFAWASAFLGADDNTSPEATTISTANPPSLTPSWGAANTLWMTFNSTGAGASNTYPTNYNLYQMTREEAPTRQRQAAGRELNAASEDPGNWPQSGDTNTITMAVKPAAQTYQAFSGFLTPNEPFLEMSVDTSLVDLGTLDTAIVKTGTATFKTRTYVDSGYSVKTVSQPPTAPGGATLNPLSSPTTSSPGTEQFGINLVDNSSPDVGLNPSPQPDSTFASGRASTGYGTTNQFKYAVGDTIADSGINGWGLTIFTISYIGNISPVSEAGRYTMVHDLVIVATY